jgi:hypothetical protein
VRDFMNDYAAEQLKPGVTVPSTMFKAVPAEELAAAVEEVVARLDGACERRLYDDVSNATWRLANAFSAMQFRLDVAAESIRTLYGQLAEADRRSAVMRHDAESQIADMHAQAKRATEDAVRGVNREASDLRLQLDLAQAELGRARGDAVAMHERMQANLNAAMRDMDGQLHDMRDRLVVAERTASNMKQREDVLRQLVELKRRDVERMAGADRQMHELRERGLQQQLQALQAEGAGGGARISAGDGGGGGGKDDVSTAVQRATHNMRERLEACVEELQVEQKKHDKLANEIAVLRIEVEKARHDAASNRDERHVAETTLAELRRENTRLAERFADVQSRSAAELDALQRQHRELEAYAQRLGRAVVDSVAQRPTAPAGQASYVPQHQGSTGLPRSSSFGERSASGDENRPVRSGTNTPLFGGHNASGYHTPAAAAPGPTTMNLLNSLRGNPLLAQPATGTAKPPMGVPISSPIKLSKPTGSFSAGQQQQPLLPSSGSFLSASGFGAAPAGGASVLTPDELERRKMEILAKYGVKPS